MVISRLVCCNASYVGASFKKSLIKVQCMGNLTVIDLYHVTPKVHLHSHPIYFWDQDRI